MEQDKSENSIMFEFGLDAENMKEYRDIAITKGDFAYLKEEVKSAGILGFGKESEFVWYWKPEGYNWLKSFIQENNVNTNNDVKEEKKVDERTGSVFKNDFPNVKLIMIRFADGEKIVATCNDNTLFRKGMHVTVKLDRHGWYVKRNPHPKSSANG